MSIWGKVTGTIGNVFKKVAGFLDIFDNVTAVKLTEANAEDVEELGILIKDFGVALVDFGGLIEEIVDEDSSGGDDVTVGEAEDLVKAGKELAVRFDSIADQANDIRKKIQF